MAAQQVSWQDKAAKKRAARLECIPEAWRLSDLEDLLSSGSGVLDIPEKCGLLSPKEIEITSKYDVVALSEKLREGKLSAVDVATAFCKRAAIAQQTTNCLTEIFFDKALARAKYLDEYLEREKKPLGPLHGVPISLKDSFHVLGTESTLGYVSFIGKTSATQDAPLAKILLNLGAVLYVKTNIPQTLMTADSDNNVFGKVLNPHKLTLSAGGSSGGEGALVAMRGSILGVGTDIGGSIRIPALCCGTYGFKPSSNRIPYGGQQGPGRAGSPGIKAAAGPLATSFRDLEFFTQLVLSQSPWNFDSAAMAIPWRPTTAKEQLIIGVQVDEPIHPLYPPPARALASAVQKLEAAGHTIIYLKDAPTAAEAMKLAAHFFSLDNSKQWLKNINASGEPVILSVQRTPDVIDAKPSGYSLEEVYDLNVARANYIHRWNKVWVENKLDVIIGAGNQNTAPPHDTYGAAPFTTMWNLVDYPGVVIPYLKADQTIDADELAKSDKTRAPYHAADVHGAPISIQLVTRNLHDEDLLAIGSVVDACLKKE